MTGFPHGFLWGAATAGHQVEGGNVNADLWPMEWAPNSSFACPARRPGVCAQKSASQRL